ncbi:hypothetical protein [Sphingomonas nostoxanthinifaciens]|uniref:hypothetical protein n=1 Tax=Sphingomonas nostoxanthinifaciens TaxID=2872652 RepID=UPI001CC1D678|nr:hypothetical protein [Sphingomonas nostoxanthinifaciens]UAK26082.1 hypothetical protein K8P63_08250 [Sphingomonas nostoxanthinifaciens]
MTIRAAILALGLCVGAVGSFAAADARPYHHGDYHHGYNRGYRGHGYGHGYNRGFHHRPMDHRGWHHR